jgi:inward rectifier potassium channel
MPGKIFLLNKYLYTSTVRITMAFFRKNNSESKQNKDTGFSNIASSNAGRFLNRDGSFNIRREGLPFFSRLSVYQALLNLSSLAFLLVTLLSILLLNLLFTAAYYWIGLQHFQGFITHSSWGQLKEIFYFSAQTFTTVGYGRINPTGDAVNIIASMEAITGFLSFAFITGLLYGRFSKPKAHLIFSDVAIVAPYNGITGLMFRFASGKDTQPLTDVSVQVNLGMVEKENDKPVYKFYELDLERKKIESLSMNFTVVHPINENSPLWQLTEQDFKEADVELYILVRAYNDVYSATVHTRTSYIYSEIKHGMKFAPMYRENEDGTSTILELQHLNKTINVTA